MARVWVCRGPVGYETSTWHGSGFAKHQRGTGLGSARPKELTGLAGRTWTKVPAVKSRFWTMGDGSERGCVLVFRNEH